MSDTAKVLLSIRGDAQPDWESLVNSLHDSELDSPRRSTIPLVTYWQDGPATKLASLLKQLGFPATFPLTLSFEHSVSVVRGTCQQE
jgi:hypothetical protein